ncbi:DUF4411 family protein [Sphingomonas faeni]|uniref:DUF4411 family protein n=1 Tax=Sphingomonas faeni TaxID=185950 RepID=UPI0020BD71CD|nr:DUF4411 family protein [Sphingomonas faeni]MCK8457543.1 DUF4411 family protein [Sphingomonas faeni]
MIYLLDANALINSHKTWYALHRVPEFWRWLVYHAEAGSIKMPSEIYGEIEGGNDALTEWVKEETHKKALLLVEESDLGKVQAVLSHYSAILSDADVIKIGQDPFLVAAAMGHSDRVVVTAETWDSKKQGANKKVPNICEACGVTWRTPIQLINELDFTTAWDLL